MFNALAYANKLKEAGFTDKQAETQATVLSEIIESDLATKLDIELVRRDIKELETASKRDMKDLEVALKRDIKELELKFEGQFILLRWMLGVVMAGILSLVLKAFFVP